MKLQLKDLYINKQMCAISCSMEMPIIEIGESTDERAMSLDLGISGFGFVTQSRLFFIEKLLDSRV